MKVVMQMAANGIVEIDLHRLTQVQSRTAIDAALRRADRSVYRLRIIHGFNGGTALRDMIRREYGKHPKVIRVEIGLNQGCTDLVLRELF